MTFKDDKGDEIDIKIPPKLIRQIVLWVLFALAGGLGGGKVFFGNDDGDLKARFNTHEAVQVEQMKTINEKLDVLIRASRRNRGGQE